jgi:hypothetical protein
MMEAADTSEKSINFYQTTRRNISDDIHFILKLIFEKQMCEV